MGNPILKLQCSLFSVIKLGISKSVSSESGLDKRQKDKKCHFTLGRALSNAGTLQENMNLTSFAH